jgi:hypothetical protein
MVDLYNMETAKLILTKKEIEQFKQFQKHIELFNILLSAGALEIKYGKAILTFFNGELVNLVKEESVYQRIR